MLEHKDTLSTEKTDPLVIGTQTTRRRKPAWLKRPLPNGPDYEKVRHLLSGARLSTVCQEAKCPNMWECFSSHTATFMILGSECTRNCRFCNVTPGRPPLPDPDEPRRVAQAAKELGLSYVVVTSVTRDDLTDGGAAHFAAVIRDVRQQLPDDTRIEVLIPDFQGDKDALQTVLEARPDVLNHNIETVPELYAKARPEAVYQRSLDLLRRAADHGAMPVKSGIMVGLGETRDQLTRTLKNLKAHGCDILTIGQYLQPSKQHLPVDRYYRPEEFDALAESAKNIGFSTVSSGPFVRSSYQARQLCEPCRNKTETIPSTP